MEPNERNGKSGSKEGLTHFDLNGRPRMVDVSAKDNSLREAYARGEILMNNSTLETIRTGDTAKGDVLATAQVAAIMAVKETGRLIPMAHPLSIAGVDVDFQFVPRRKEGPENDRGDPLRDSTGRVEIGVRVKLTGQTGVEMEALTGVSIAALTIYDMCKAIDKSMVIGNIRLEEKTGGRSGHFTRPNEDKRTK